MDSQLKKSRMSSQRHRRAIRCNKGDILVLKELKEEWKEGKLSLSYDLVAS